MKNQSKRAEKRYIVKPCFPDLEIAFLGFSVFCLGIVIMQILKGKQEFIYLLPLPFISFIFGYFFANYRVKKVEKVGADLIIKPLLKKSKRYNVKNIQGYQIYETCDRSGLIKQIRLIDIDGKRIIFVRDAYNDEEYEKLIYFVKCCGFLSLGYKEIKWKYKHAYGTIASISFILAMLLFSLLRIIKD